jgi:hypothetical protein
MTSLISTSFRIDLLHATRVIASADEEFIPNILTCMLHVIVHEINASNFACIANGGIKDELTYYEYQFSFVSLSISSTLTEAHHCNKRRDSLSNENGGFDSRIAKRTSYSGRS